MENVLVLNHGEVMSQSLIPSDPYEVSYNEETETITFRVDDPESNRFDLFMGDYDTNGNILFMGWC
jgi:hypothetical protein